jgi:hypothetical protein
MLDVDNTITKLTENNHLVALVVLLPPKKLITCCITKSGCSSGIQCPESGTVTPVTFAAKACVAFNVVLPGRSPPKAG